MIIHHQRFGDALAFIVAAAKPDRVNVAEIVLRLWMDQRVAVNFACRSLQNTRLYAFCQPEHIDHTHYTGLNGFDWIVLVVNWRSGTGKIIDLIDLEHYRFGHVVTNQFEILTVKKVRNILLAAGEKVVEADDLVALVQEPFAKMRADKARTACDQYSVQNAFSVRVRSITQATTIASAGNIWNKARMVRLGSGQCLR